MQWWVMMVAGTAVPAPGGCTGRIQLLRSVVRCFVGWQSHHNQWSWSSSCANCMSALSIAATSFVVRRCLIEASHPLIGRQVPARRDRVKAPCFFICVSDPRKFTSRGQSGRMERNGSQSRTRSIQSPLQPTLDFLRSSVLGPKFQGRKTPKICECDPKLLLCIISRTGLTIIIVQPTEIKVNILGETPQFGTKMWELFLSETELYGG